MNDRYETRQWDATRKVRVQVAPGRFEGEPIFVQHFAAAAGWADYSASDQDGVFADVFRAPFNLDTLPEVEGLETLTEDEQAILDTAAGAVVYYRSDGFVSLELLSTTEDVDRAINALTEEEAGQSEE